MSIIDDAMQFLKLSSDAESYNRAEALEDLKFVAGDQWPAELQNSRQLEARPCLTINKLDGYCRQVSNQQRQQRPRIMVHPTNGIATKKISDVLSGMCRHIEVNSNADAAYDTAFDLAVKMGWGYWRIVTDYVRENSFDQEIYINPIENAFTVYFDPNSVLPDGSDAEKCLVTEVMPKSTFRKLYPGKDDGSNFSPRGTGDDMAMWVTKEDIRIAEYFYVTKKSATLYMLSDKSSVWEDELPSEEILKQSGLFVVDKRKSFKRVVNWCKLTAMDVLEEREWPGRWIPIVPVYGNIVVIGDKRKKFGMVRFGKDPQRMVNYWETAATETIAMAPKAKWLIAEGQDEGHENEWARANISAMPILRYKPTDINGQPAPPPSRLQPEPPPVGILQALQISTQNMREVLGISDPAQRITGNVSGKALVSEKQQSDNATFHYYDNLTRSIQHTGRIILDLIPKIYDAERVTRIIGDDGQPDLITINKRTTTAEGEILDNNVTVGEYDVIMDTGPGYNSKRQEAVDAMAPLMQNEEIMKVIGDLFFRNSDFPGSEVIADRLAAMNPLAQIDDKSPIPPQIQMKLKQDQQVIQQLQQQLQAAMQEIKLKHGLEAMKQAGETQREHMRVTVKAHDTETWAAENIRQQQMGDETKRFDTETRAHTAMTVEEIKGHIALLLKRMDGNTEEVQK